jgi:hypothetical protein
MHGMIERMGQELPWHESHILSGLTVLATASDRSRGYV